MKKVLCVVLMVPLLMFAGAKPTEPVNPFKGNLAPAPVDGPRPAHERATAPPSDGGEAGGSDAGGSDAGGSAEVKPEGQQMIDRLVARLREEGMGAEAARLVTVYGGYGRDASAQRELYAKLRALLVERSARS